MGDRWWSTDSFGSCKRLAICSAFIDLVNGMVKIWDLNYPTMEEGGKVNKLMVRTRTDAQLKRNDW